MTNAQIGFARAALVVALLSLASCGFEPRADNPRELARELVAALERADVARATAFFLDADAYIAECPDRFADQYAIGRFRRKHANGRARFVRSFETCMTLVEGPVMPTKRWGGEKRRNAAGCSEGVWEYADVVWEVEAASGPRRIKVDGIVGIGGRAYVVERLACR